MSWAEVFKINSDMSTSLDKLIKGQRSLAASDNEMVELVGGREIQSGTYFASFIPKTNGSVRLKAGLLGASESSTGSITVYEDETFKTRLTGENYSDVVEYDMTIFEGKEYRFYLATGFVRYLRVCANIVDTSLFDYTTGG